jgi:hypothetical protein
VMKIVKFIKEKKWQRLAIYGVLIGAGVVFFGFVITCTWIGYSVKDHCEDAQKRFEGDCVESLVKVAEDERMPYGERNSAVWALGQLGDKRALPALEGLYTGEIPDREPWNGVLSQYELKKAVKLLRGGFNASAIVWRNSWILGED